MVESQSVLQVHRREQKGSRAMRRLRQGGNVPGIIYGHKETPVAITLNAHELRGVVSEHGHTLKIDLGGNHQQLLIKDVQYDHLGLEILHVDLARVSMDERVRVEVPIELRGHAAGVKEGGVLDQRLAQLEVECVVINIPDSIRVSVTNLQINDAIHVKDLEFPPNVNATVDDDVMVAQVRVIAEQEEAVEETEGEAEPELIGRPAKEAEGDKKAEVADEGKSAD